MRRTRTSDLLLPLFVVGIVGMMVLPLPRWSLDVLLMFNISASIVLLIHSVHLSEPQKFTTLPTLLLLTTLFRLGLNVSTSRQLLSEGKAPEVVVAFGNFVAGGNLVVGVVLFVILTIVQFLVITKGAERVAEVSARFTLDALPGKQMSIDADLRAGILDVHQARTRRLELQRESRLFGALDGAMKFVKGDAIAAILITFVNIGAGLLLGMTEHGLSFQEALRRYTIFTIGDGLVSQIPALLVAVAAGIAVTRVSEEEDSFVGKELMQQLTQEPRVLGTAGFAVGLLGFVPGMPTFICLVAGLGLIFGAVQGRLRDERNVRRSEEVRFAPKNVSRLMLQLSAQGARMLQQENVLPALMERFRQNVFDEFGIVLPEIHYEVLPQCTAPALVVFDAVERQQVLPENLGLSEAVMKSMRGLVLPRLAEFVNDTHTRTLLELLQSEHEDLVNSLIPAQLSVTSLSTLLRELVKEKVCIRNLARILQAVAEHSLVGKALGAGEHRTADAGPADLLAEVRVALAPVVCRSILGERQQLKSLVLSAATEMHLQGEASFAQASLRGQLQEAFRDILQRRSSEVDELVVLCSKYVRASVARILRVDNPLLPVLAFEELLPNIEILPVEEIDVPWTKELGEPRKLRAV